MQESKNETANPFSETEIDQAFQLARQRRLPVLIDYWAPGCKGCKKMDLTTYRHDTIVAYLQAHFVFVKYNVTNKGGRKLSSSPVLWTPCFVVFANDGSDVRKTSGYLPDAQFRSEMEIGRALAFLRKAQYQAALDVLETVVAAAACESLTPEAMYWSGVAAYFLHRRDANRLVPFWDKLMRNYPTSDWAKKADCLEVAAA